jgi:fatty-acyl-CoA synthase
MTPNEAWLQAIQRTAAIAKRPELTLAQLVHETALRTPEAPAIVSAQARWSYAELSSRVAGYQHWALRHKLGKGDTVALLMANRPDYLAIWLGLAQSGATVALLNTNLTGAALLHCIRAAGAKTVVVAAALSDRVPDQGLSVWLHGEGTKARPSIDGWIAGNPVMEPLSSLARLEDRALYIYTSGTTGLPKAASVSHQRIMQWAEWFAGMGGLTPSDRIYNCLPLYHSVGGVVAVGAALAAGGSVFVRDGFSARRFWAEVADNDCTVFQYIGELCRYLLNSPADPASARHSLRLACGNGLKGDIWDDFKTRFAIPQILEFYASTEGSFSLFNYEQQPGSIGRIPGFVNQRENVALIGVDAATGVPVRDGAGLCKRVAVGQPGEAMNRLSASSGTFEGYADAAASQSKVLRDVLAPGDAWYRSGDLMRQDAKGFFYFVDRIGDTFRWKGENVSSAEVTDVIRAAAGVLDADVFGVAVPGADGKAGMAALVVDGYFHLATFRSYLEERLPAYARPLFVRLRPSLERTSTFKADKQQLQRDGFDFAATPDAIYVDAGGYVRVDAQVMRAIANGKLRL